MYHNLGLLQTRSWAKNILGSIMGNLSTSWLVVWPRVINNILFVLGSISSHVKSLMSK
jgi:hypothetical protein